MFSNKRLTGQCLSRKLESQVQFPTNIKINIKIKGEKDNLNNKK